MFEINSFELKVGMTKQEFLQANKDLPNASTIFDTIDCDNSKAIEEEEFRSYNNTTDKNITLANQKNGIKNRKNKQKK